MSIEEIENHITSIEMSNKELSIWQKVVIAHERYVIGMKYNKSKSAKLAKSIIL